MSVDRPTRGPVLPTRTIPAPRSRVSTPTPQAPSRAPAPAPATPPPPTPPRAAGPGGGPQATTQTEKWGVPLIVVVVGMFMSILDTSIVNVAIPTIQKEFGTSVEGIQWISTAYTLCLGVVVPTSAWLGDRLGLKRLYLITLVSFAAFSALCGMAWDLGSMVAFRILQAVPGGIIPVTCLTILYRLVPPRRLGTAMGLYGLGIVFAPGIGPTLGGYLVEYVNWRLIFYINVPIGVLGMIAAMMVLPKFPAAAARRFDLPGFLCVAAGLFALLLALSKGQDWGWTSYRVLMLVAGSVDLLVLFVIIERQVRAPLLDVRVFAHWAFVNSLLLISILSVGLFAVLFYVPLFLQQAQGLTAMNTGLVVLPQALVLAVMMPTAGRLYDKIGPRIPAVVGLLVAGFGTLLLTSINIDMTRSELIVWMMIRAAGFGLCMMPIMTSGISALPPQLINYGSTFNTLVQRVTAALGLAVLTAMATAQQAQQMANRAALLHPGGADADPRILAMERSGPAGLIPLWERLRVEVEAQAYSNVFLVAAVFTFVGVVLALFLRHGKAGGAGEGGPAEVG